MSIRTTKTTKANTVQANIKEQEISKKLTFELTQEEIANKGRDAAKLSKELFELELDFDDVKKAWKARISAKSQELSKTLKVIDAGTEDREVVCTCRKDYDSLTVQYIYGGKLMEERAMSIEERQLELDFEKKKRQKEAQAKLKESESERPSDAQRELRDVIREETNAKKKVDLVV